MYTNFEQDLILACKCHYGENGIEKVIRDYIGYAEDQEITLDSKYHFISELYVKMFENKHLKLYFLLQDRLSPRHIYDHEHRENVLNRHNYSLYDFPRIVCDHMIAEIQGVKVYNSEKNEIIIELHEPDEKFKDKEETFYRIEADMNISDLSVDYSENEYDIAINHFKKWLEDDEVFNECFYKITTVNSKIVNKEMVDIV
jgi:hypothetical protein